MDRKDGSGGDRPPTNPNIFDDEYALDMDEDDFMPAVSDGFRPADVSNNETRPNDRPSHDRGDSPRPQLTNTPIDADLRRLASRNSTMKMPYARDGAPPDVRNPAIRHSRGPSSQATAALQHRASVSSTASFATMGQSEDRFGSGPSHPYGMYPQTTMARSPSVTTSSTQRQPHRSMSLQRPTHPYGMYTQNTVEDEAPVPPVQSAIPVGFPGNATRYHRQIGPDGEEQDIIGPDGHTEQLPPYSRYPENSPSTQSQEDHSKAAQVADAAVAPVQIPVAAPIASQETVLSPVSPITPVEQLPQVPQMPTLAHSRDPLPAAPPQAPSQAPSVLSASERGSVEKNGGAAKDESWRSRKLWGKVPMGVALILLVLVLIFAVVLGAAIGTFVVKNKGKNDKDDGKHNKPSHDEPSPQVTGPPPSLFDATPISTPTSLPPLPTGQFALPLGVAQESSPACLVVANQLSAWSCQMTIAPLVLIINDSPSNNPPTAQVQALTTSDGSISYGVQSPNLPEQTLQLVVDLDYKAYGPAYHFSARYDKMVIINQDEFAAGAALSRRQEKPIYRHRFQVMPGDEPWYCFWNETYIEGYVYVTDNSTAATYTAYPTGWPSDLYTTSVPVETPGPATVLVTPASTGAASSPIPTPTPARRKRDSSGSQRLPPYPRIVKIEERRLPSSQQPYCQKMQLLDSGIVQPATDSNEQPIFIMLQEDDPTIQEFLQAGSGPPLSSPSASSSGSNATERRRSVDRRTDPAGACHCQWMFQ